MNIKPLADRVLIKIEEAEIERMLEKLSGHWMFRQKPEQMQRLRMCFARCHQEVS